jgi:uncharacterized protein YecE (DUF72 family)
VRGWGGKNVADLTAFLTMLPRQDVDLALEVRHLDWFKSPYREQLNELLTRLGVGRVILDSRPIYAAARSGASAIECKKPNVPLDLTLTDSFRLTKANIT